MRRPRSPFDILGVSPADDMTTIRLAWRAKVRRLHPDRAPDAARASAELAEVNAAFDALQGHGPKRDAQPGAVSLRVVVSANGATDACGRAIRGYLAARPIIAAA